MGWLRRRLVVVAALVALVGSRFVDLYKDPSGQLYYLVVGYAMANQSDYQAVFLKSACLCRRRCQVSARCHSVSIVPKEGGVECRTSLKPKELNYLEDRPVLSPINGSRHMLETVDLNIEEDGLGYWKCNPGFHVDDRAVATTQQQFNIMCKMIEKTKTKTLLVGLYYNKDSTGGLYWHYGDKKLTFEGTLDPSVLVNPTGPFFYLKKIEGAFKLVGSHWKNSWALCTHNPLNLENPPIWQD